MVSGRPSKVLSGWTYESQPKPLRSPRTAGDFCETEVPDTEDEGNSTYFNEFSKLLLNGQSVADDTKRPYVFYWRGYKACISSNLPKLNIHEMRRRFKLAMIYVKENSSLDVEFKKPISKQQPQSKSSSSSRIPLNSSQEVTQIPDTQFEMEGNINIS